MRGHIQVKFRGGRFELLRGGSKHNSLSQTPDLAKLNPSCHTNYSNVFTKLVSI